MATLNDRALDNGLSVLDFEAEKIQTKPENETRAFLAAPEGKEVK